MRRPALVNFMSIETDQHLAVKTALTTKDFAMNSGLAEELSQAPSRPLQSLQLFRGRPYRLRLVVLDGAHQEIYNKSFDSDLFGNFSFTIPQIKFRKPIFALEVYECQFREGLELLLGSFIPLRIPSPQKIVISDFDKTLVDTRYSTTREIYQSVTNPVNYFPSVAPSIELLKNFIQQGFQPFILSASPHFYEHALRDWLYQNEIYTAGIFLKDYRKVFSIFEGDLYPKDIKAQGFYKLNQLVEILLMAGIPQELVLIGDGFESDPLIYLILHRLLTERMEPWDLWKLVRATDAFRLTRKQNSYFLNKLYLLRQKLQDSAPPTISIHIRVKERNHPIHYYLPMIEERASLIQFFEA